MKEKGAECRPCLEGDKHYKVTCNNCEIRLAQAKELLPEAVLEINLGSSMGRANGC